MLLYLSQVQLLAIHPFYTNLLPTPIIISHHLFPAPCISVWNNYVSLPSLHSLQLFAYSLIARTLYVTKVHDGLEGLISSMDGASMQKCVDTIFEGLLLPKSSCWAVCASFILACRFEPPTLLCEVSRAICISCLPVSVKLLSFIVGYCMKQVED